MGPRDRRRLAVAAIGLGVVAAIVAAVLLLARSPHPAPPAADRSGASVPIVVRPGVTAKLSYGMTKQEVLRHAGKPTKSVRDPNGSNCWQYDTKQRQIGLNAIRVCFFDGRYSVYYMQVNGQWNYKPRKITVTS